MDIPESFFTDVHADEFVKLRKRNLYDGFSQLKPYEQFCKYYDVVQFIAIKKLLLAQRDYTITYACTRGWPMLMYYLMCQSDRILKPAVLEKAIRLACNCPWIDLLDFVVHSGGKITKECLTIALHSKYNNENKHAFLKYILDHGDKLTWDIEDLGRVSRYFPDGLVDFNQYAVSLAEHCPYYLPEIAKHLTKDSLNACAEILCCDPKNNENIIMKLVPLIDNYDNCVELLLYYGGLYTDIIRKMRDYYKELDYDRHILTICKSSYPKINIFTYVEKRAKIKNYSYWISLMPGSKACKPVLEYLVRLGVKISIFDFLMKECDEECFRYVVEQDIEHAVEALFLVSRTTGLEKNTLIITQCL